MATKNPRRGPLLQFSRESPRIQPKEKCGGGLGGISSDSKMERVPLRKVIKVACLCFASPERTGGRCHLPPDSVKGMQPVGQGHIVPLTAIVLPPRCWDTLCR